MKAVVLRELGAPEQLRLEEVADPAPGPGEVVIRLAAAALNHRDAWIRHGLYAGIKLPIILGSDGAGTVEGVGDGVDPSLAGTQVVINPSLGWGDDQRAQAATYRILGLPDDGTYAELVKVPAANVAAKPPALSWEEAAAIPLAGLTAYRALVTRARVMPGEMVLVTGIGGGVATLAMRIAQHLGARVFVTSGSDRKIELAVQAGASGGVNYKHESWGKELAALCPGGPDVVIDSAGKDTWPTLIDQIRPGGRIVTFGATTGSQTTVEVRRIFWKQISVLGTTMGTAAEFAAMVQLFADGLKPIVDQVFPLSEAAASHQRMDQAEQFGKIVLKIE